MLLGAVCFATVLVSAALIATMVSTTNSRDVVQIPGALQLVDVEGTHENWNVETSAIVGTTYDQGLTFTSSWAGDYQIQVCVDATGSLTATDVTVTCDAPAATISGEGTVWQVDNGKLWYNLPTQSSIGDGSPVSYVFTITINTPQSGVNMHFTAVSPESAFQAPQA